MQDMSEQFFEEREKFENCQERAEEMSQLAVDKLMQSQQAHTEMTDLRLRLSKSEEHLSPHDGTVDKAGGLGENFLSSVRSPRLSTQT